MLLNDLVLEHRDECKDAVEESAGVSDQQLLAVHGQCRNEDL